MINCKPSDGVRWEGFRKVSSLELATAMRHRTLQILQRYIHLNAQITKKFSRGVAEKVMRVDSETIGT